MRWFNKKCKHDWEKWSDPRNTVMGEGSGVGYLSVCQYRICKICGICEYRKLPEMRSIRGIEEQINKLNKKENQK